MRQTITSRLAARGGATAKAIQIQGRWDALDAKRREVDAEQRSIEAEVGRLREELTAAYETAELEVGPDGKPHPRGANVRKLEAAHAKAIETANEPRGQRLAGIERALDRLVAEHHQHLRTHRDEILAVLTPAAIETNDAAHEALTVLRDALSKRAQIGRELESLLNATEGPGRGVVVDLSGEQLRRELDRVELEPPIPNLLRSDPTMKSAA